MLPFTFHWGWRRLAGIGWGRGLVLAVLSGAPYSLIFMSGMSFAPVSHGATIAPSSAMLSTLLISWLWLGERATARRVAAALFVLAGLLTMGWDGLTATAGPQAWIGDLTFVTAGVVWGIFTYLCRRWNIDPWRTAAAVWSLSLLLYALPYALFVKPAFAAPWPELLVQAVYQGALGAIVATVAYTRAVTALGAARAAFFPALVPAIAVLTAVPVLGELPTVMQAIGVGVVIGGMILAIGR
jgi:drug/metabolite transporter (DMT)-like permease